MLKSHSCGELRKGHVGVEVTLSGWVDRRRDHGGVIFIDLRDREGIVQVVFNPEVSKQSHEIAYGLRNEYVVRISGKVGLRPPGTENARMATGEIEVIAHKADILNTSKTPPFYINEDVEIEENLRLKYRYLDLRRDRMKNNLLLRHKTVKFMRDFLDVRGFIEVETPMLIKSTPEGARDYLVPSRIYPGKFYALPQSPQQLKQLLMVAGVEKYFQIARCFRDEDLRADRQPEFTQLDLEMSFVEVEDVLRLLEELFTSTVETLRPDMRLIKPFPRLTFAQAMERYGSDKPDLRYGLQMADLSDIAAETEFSVFRSAVAAGGKVKGICAPCCGAYTRHHLNELESMAKSLGAGGLTTIALGTSAGSVDELTGDSLRSVATKFMTLDQVREMGRRLGARAGDLLLLLAGKQTLIETVLGAMRQEVARRLSLADPKVLAFAFIVEFPLFTKDEKTGRWEATHHPFTAPKDDDAHLLDTAPEKARSKHYDMVCNGFELAGGSIRIHTGDMQRKVFRFLGYTDAEIDERFGHLLEAFEYGAPPHGGVAPGIDRFVMLLAGEQNIREVIAFPKTQSAVDLTLNAPALVREEQLAELHLRVIED